MADEKKSLHQWMTKKGPKYLLDKEHERDLERQAAVYEFIDGKGRDEAEDDAYKEYRGGKHKEACKRHYKAMKAAEAAGEKDTAERHNLLYEMHLRATGAENNGEVPDFVTTDDGPSEDKKKDRIVRFRNHPADSYLLERNEDGVMYGEALMKSDPAARLIVYTEQKKPGKFSPELKDKSILGRIRAKIKGDPNVKTSRYVTVVNPEILSQKSESEDEFEHDGLENRTNMHMEEALNNPIVQKIHRMWSVDPAGASSTLRMIYDGKVQDHEYIPGVKLSHILNHVSMHQNQVGPKNNLMQSERKRCKCGEISLTAHGYGKMADGKSKYTWHGEKSCNPSDMKDMDSPNRFDPRQVKNEFQLNDLPIWAQVKLLGMAVDNLSKADPPKRVRVANTPAGRALADRQAGIKAPYKEIQEGKKPGQIVPTEAGSDRVIGDTNWIDELEAAQQPLTEQGDDFAQLIPHNKYKNPSDEDMRRWREDDNILPPHLEDELEDLDPDERKIFGYSGKVDPTSSSPVLSRRQRKKQEKSKIREEREQAMREFQEAQRKKREEDAAKYKYQTPMPEDLNDLQVLQYKYGTTRVPPEFDVTNASHWSSLVHQLSPDERRELGWKLFDRDKKAAGRGEPKPAVASDLKSGAYKERMDKLLAQQNPNPPKETSYGNYGNYGGSYGYSPPSSSDAWRPSGYNPYTGGWGDDDFMRAEAAFETVVGKMPNLAKSEVFDLCKKDMIEITLKKAIAEGLLKGMGPGKLTPGMSGGKEAMGSVQMPKMPDTSKVKPLGHQALAAIGEANKAQKLKAPGQVGKAGGIKPMASVNAEMPKALAPPAPPKLTTAKPPAAGGGAPPQATPPGAALKSEKSSREEVERSLWVKPPIEGTRNSDIKINPNEIKTRDEGIRRQVIAPGTEGANKHGVGIFRNRKKYTRKEKHKDK